MTLKTPDQINTLIAKAYAMRLQLIIRAVMPGRMTKLELDLARFWANKPIF